MKEETFFSLIHNERVNYIYTRSIGTKSADNSLPYIENHHPTKLGKIKEEIWYSWLDLVIEETLLEKLGLNKDRILTHNNR